jgi:ribosomal protein S27E
MNKQLSTVVLLLGVIVVVFVGIRLISKQAKARTEEKQKTAFKERLMAREVVCDDCGVTSPMDVIYTQRRKFQVCPSCGQKKARPIVYFMCNNPECNRQLIRFVNHVMDGSTFYESPQGGVTCPNCGRKDTVEPRELSIAEAAKTAKETGQSFPYSVDN